ncbi:MAG: SIS domain-containing protein, partial [Patescibacteria group bacterium]
GALITGIVNVVGSTISRITEAGVYNQIGPEISVASTKAFSSQVLLLLLHAMYLYQIQNNKNYDDSVLFECLQSIKTILVTMLNNKEQIDDIANKYQHVSDMYYLGLKYSYPIALEGALKLKEISPSIHAEGLSAGELKHGFIALIDENRPTIAFCTRDSVYAKARNAIEQVKARKGKVIVILSDESDVQENEEFIIVPYSHEFLQPILCNVVSQLIAYYCSLHNGFDVDRPRNLAKSVTVE